MQSVLIQGQGFIKCNNVVGFQVFGVGCCFFLYIRNQHICPFYFMYFISKLWGKNIRNVQINTVRTFSLEASMFFHISGCRGATALSVP